MQGLGYRAGQQAAALMSNPFASYAEDAKPVWQQRKEATAARRVERARQEAIGRAEQDLLDKLYRQWRRDLASEMRAGQYGKEIEGLIKFMRKMTPNSAPALIKLVERAEWLGPSCPKDVRYFVLRLVSHAITRVRENAGYEPYDDPWPDEAPNAFMQIRDLLRGEDLR